MEYHGTRYKFYGMGPERPEQPQFVYRDKPGKIIYRETRLRENTVELDMPIDDYNRLYRAAPKNGPIRFIIGDDELVCTGIALKFNPSGPSCVIRLTSDIQLREKKKS